MGPESRKKVWAITHNSHEDMGSYEFFCRAMGVRPSIFLAHETDVSALDPLEADLVLIMGGPMGVYEANSFPHLHHEIRLAERRMAAGKPLLGICLGAQIMAKALGADVYKGKPGREIGWFDMTATEDGQKSPLRHFDKSQGPVVEWHQDTFDLPAGAKRLLTGKKYENQAFSYGDNAIAIQFHPEVTELKFERWYVKYKDELAEMGTPVEYMRAEAHKYADKLRERNRVFFTEWLTKVAPQLLGRTPPATVDG